MKKVRPVKAWAVLWKRVIRNDGERLFVYLKKSTAQTGCFSDEEPIEVLITPLPALRRGRKRGGR